MGSTGNLFPHGWSPGSLPPKGPAIFSDMALHALPAPPAACKAHRADASCAVGMAAPTPPICRGKPNRVRSYEAFHIFLLLLLALNCCKALCFHGTAPQSPLPGAMEQSVRVHAALGHGVRGHCPAMLARTKMGSLGFVSLRLLCFFLRLKRMQTFPDVENNKNNNNNNKNRRKKKKNNKRKLIPTKLAGRERKEMKGKLKTKRKLCSCVFAHESQWGWAPGTSLPVPLVWSPSPCPWLASFTVRKGLILGAEQGLGLLVPGVVLPARRSLWQRHSRGCRHHPAGEPHGERVVGERRRACG